MFLSALAAREGNYAFLTPEAVRDVSAARSDGHILHVDSLTSARLNRYEGVTRLGNVITAQDEENFLAGSRTEAAIQYGNHASNRAAQLAERVRSRGPIDREIIVRTAHEMDYALVPTGGALVDF